MAMSDPQQPEATSAQRPPEAPFKAIAPDEYQKMDAVTKRRIITARHLGIVRSCEKSIAPYLNYVLQSPQEGGEEPYSLEDVVVVLLNKDDPFTPQKLRDSFAAQDLEVGILVNSRTILAKSLLETEMQYCPDCDMQSRYEDCQECPQCTRPVPSVPRPRREDYRRKLTKKEQQARDEALAEWAPWRVNKPYTQMAKTLFQKSPPGTVYAVVFDSGAATITFFAYDPNNPDLEAIPADPNHPAPPPVERLSTAEEVPPLATPSRSDPTIQFDAGQK